MLIKQAPDIRSSEITPERLYYSRRQFIHAASGAAIGAAGAAVLGQPAGGLQAAPQEDLPDLRPSQFSTDERQNSYEEITSYNNFYEFGLDKEDPKRYADELTVKALDGARRGPHEPPGRRLRARGHPEPAHARGAHLPAALRRGVVDGRALGRLPAP